MLTFPTLRSYQAAVALNPALEAVDVATALRALWLQRAQLLQMMRSDTLEVITIAGKRLVRYRDVQRWRVARQPRITQLREWVEAAGRRGEPLERREAMLGLDLNPNDPADAAEMSAILCEVAERGMADGGLMLCVICQRRVGRNWVFGDEHFRVYEAYGIDADDLRGSRRAEQALFEHVCTNLRLHARSRPKKRKARVNVTA